MEPYRPKYLLDAPSELWTDDARPLSVVLLAITALAASFFVVLALFFPALQAFFKPRFGTEAPLLLLIPTLCLSLWFRMPSARLMILSGILFLLIGLIYYWQTLAHTTLWGTVETVLRPRGDRLDSTLLWCAAPFVGCGLFLVFTGGQLIWRLRKMEGKRGQEIGTQVAK